MASKTAVRYCELDMPVSLKNKYRKLRVAASGRQGFGRLCFLLYSWQPAWGLARVGYSINMCSIDDLSGNGSYISQTIETTYGSKCKATTSVIPIKNTK